jgi:hypothetical protein
MAEFIEILSPSALKDLTTANDEVVKLISNINSAGKAMQSIKTPSGSDSAVKNLSNNLIAQEKNIQKVQQALEKARIEEIKLQQAREKAFDKYDAQLAKEQAKLNASQNIYNKVQQKLNALSNEYKNLAVKKELGGKLTDAEAKRYDYLSSRITKYDTTLKAVDASMGKYQRNVGNYASAFNPLSNSINQLTREMPAFANSVQTGFMAISNNLPIFFDAISQIREQNKALQEESRAAAIAKGAEAKANAILQGATEEASDAIGEQVTALAMQSAEGIRGKGVLRQLASAFLSWGTALSVGVTLLTVFGDEIVDAIFNTKAKAKADEDAKKVIESKNKAEQDYIDTIRNSASEEISRSKTLFENARNVNIAMKDRLSYIKELKERYPDYLGNLRDQDILAGNTAEAEERLNDALIKRGIALAIQDKITEKYKALTDEIIKLEEAQKRSSKSEEIANTISQKTGTNKEVELKRAQLLNRLGIANSKENIKTKNDEIKSLFNLFNSYAPYLTAVRESTEASKKEDRVRKELIKSLRQEYLERTKIDDLKSVELEEGFLARLKQQKKAFEELQSTLSSSNKEYAEYQKLIDGIQQSIDLIEDPSKVITSTGPAEFMKKYKKETKEDLDETKSYWEKHGEEVVDLSQELINTLAEISNQRFENQLNNLEKEKNTALLFAGDSVAAREEIERQAEVRRRAILARQAKAQKEMAIFNIITDTAQAVVASLIRDPSGTLAILIGAIGAANLALVASQQVPAFKDGGIHEGGLMMVNDQKGSKYKEIIETPDGKKRIFNERNKILNAPKGTKIYNATETESILFNNELNGILTNNGISNAPTVIVDGGLSKEDFNNGISKLAKTITEKESFSISRDKRGERVFREKQNKRTELLNVRLKMGKYDV